MGQVLILEPEIGHEQGQWRCQQDRVDHGPARRMPRGSPHGSAKNAAPRPPPPPAQPATRLRRQQENTQRPDRIASGQNAHRQPLNGGFCARRLVRGPLPRRIRHDFPVLHLPVGRITITLAAEPSCRQAKSTQHIPNDVENNHQCPPQHPASTNAPGPHSSANGWRLPCRSPTCLRPNSPPYRR